MILEKPVSYHVIVKPPISEYGHRWEVRKHTDWVPGPSDTIATGQEPTAAAALAAAIAALEPEIQTI